MTNLIVETGVVKTVFGTIDVKATEKLDANVQELVECGGDYSIFNVNVQGAEFNTFSAHINGELVTFEIDEYEFEVEYQAKTNHFIITLSVKSKCDNETLDNAVIKPFDLSIMGTINSDDDKELFINTSIRCQIVSYSFENEDNINA